ncbi:LIC_13246 family protein [Leptospira sp. 'Mane']|uniref:LIC_13246 family protein n=1 Tax=Leptospira sp. 'Mane' TaxID=3387407 RepID=UPI00398B33F0
MRCAINKDLGVKLNADGKKKFQNIMRVVNLHHAIQLKEHSEILEYRKRIVLADVKSFEIYVESLGAFAYGIICVHEEVVKEWIHVDGISEERERLEEKGIFEHPIFEITCLTDILADNKEG